MLHWYCVCDAGNGVAVSVNDIIIKLVAITLKVNTVHRLVIQHVNILEQYTDYSTCMHMYMHAYIRVYIRKCLSVRVGLRVCGGGGGERRLVECGVSNVYYNILYILMIACLTVN